MKKHKKKSVIFIGQMPPPWHGVSAINSWILKSKLLNQNYDFHVINLTTAISISDIGKQSIRKYIHFAKTVFLTLYKLLKVNPSLCYITLTPTGSAFFKDSLILFILKLFKKPIIVHFHGKGITDWVKSKPDWVKSYYQKVLNDVYLIILGNNLKSDIEIVYKQKPFVVPNGIPLIPKIEFTPSVTSGFQILFLSNLMKSKGILDFIDSIKILETKGLHFKASIIGDSGDLTLQEAKKLLAEYGLQRSVDLLGPKYKEEKYKLLSNADVLVFPTHNEAFGLVLLEAMQIGIPVITTNEGCIPEIIEHNVNGYIVEKRSPQSIADRLIHIMNNPSIKSEIGQRNKAKFKSEYTFNIFEKRMIKIFNQISL